MKTEWMDKKGQYLGLQVFALILQPFGTVVTFEYLSLMFDFFTLKLLMQQSYIFTGYWLFDTWK